jgi:hypothetical protein
MRGRKSLVNDVSLKCDRRYRPEAAWHPAIGGINSQKQVLGRAGYLLQFSFGIASGAILCGSIVSASVIAALPLVAGLIRNDPSAAFKAVAVAFVPCGPRSSVSLLAFQLSIVCGPIDANLLSDDALNPAGDHMLAMIRRLRCIAGFIQPRVCCIPCINGLLADPVALAQSRFNQLVDRNEQLIV